MVPVKPVSGVVGWACSSCPRAGWMMTSDAETAPSSGSVTATFHERLSPKSKNEPFGGSENCTVGRVLPTVIGTVVVPVWPSGSRTVRRALNTPPVR